MSDYPPNETALLLVDALNEFLADGGKLWPATKAVADATGTIPNLKRLTEGCRAAGIKVAHANHHTNEGGEYLSFKHPTPSHRRVNDLGLFLKGSFGVEVHADVAPQPGDLIAQEHWTSSGFAGTDLDMLLRQHGISRVVVAGNRVNTCIDATGRYAVELGYHSTLISDAIAAFSDDEMRATIETNWPAYGHAVLTTDGFLELIAAR